MKSLVIFASGSGTNAENIIRHFQANKKAKVAAVFCNNPRAEVTQRAEKLEVPCIVFTRKDFYETDLVEQQLREVNPDLIVLAGFLWLIPYSIIKRFHRRIINIHPALLPRHGGKGFYGNIVHGAVIKSGDNQSGITIHYVDEEFDHGEIVFQKAFDIENAETPESLGQKVHKLEYEYYPKVIEQLISDL